MRYPLSIRLKTYNAESDFDTTKERDPFLSVTKNMHPSVEVVLWEKGDSFGLKPLITTY